MLHGSLSVDVFKTYWQLYVYMWPLFINEHRARVDLVQLLDGMEADTHPECITEHVDFSNVCLCRAVLTVSLYSHRHCYRTSDIPTDENRYVS